MGLSQVHTLWLSMPAVPTVFLTRRGNPEPPGLPDPVIALGTQDFKMQLITEPGLPPLPLTCFQACSQPVGEASAQVFTMGTKDGRQDGGPAKVLWYVCAVCEKLSPKKSVSGTISGPDNSCNSRSRMSHMPGMSQARDRR